MADASTFTERTKCAEVTPIYKKKDKIAENNYRSVSILTSLSKVYESLMLAQLNGFWKSILTDYA